jgi:hypothetical protein
MSRTSQARAAHRRLVRLQPRAFPSPVGAQLRGALAVAHAEEPFSPRAVRETARRVTDLAGRLGLAATVFRGGLDVGAAEVDHVWVVVDDRVVDAAFPLFSSSFVDHLRAYVAGDVGDDELEWAAHPYSLGWRVVGAYPDEVCYTGVPVWGEGASSSSS